MALTAINIFGNLKVSRIPLKIQIFLSSRVSASAILAQVWVLHPRYEGTDQTEAGRTCSYVAQHFVDAQFGNCDDTHIRKSERQDMRYVSRHGPILGNDLSEISMGMVVVFRIVRDIRLKFQLKSIE